MGKAETTLHRGYSLNCSGNSLNKAVTLQLSYLMNALKNPQQYIKKKKKKKKEQSFSFWLWKELAIFLEPEKNLNSEALKQP